MEKDYDIRGVNAVASRGILKDIGTSLYDTSFKYRATRYKGTCYFADLASQPPEVMRRDQKIACFFGLNFRNLITNAPLTEEDSTSTADQVQVTKLVHSVVEINMDSMKVLSKAEIGGVDPATGKIVEIKCTKKQPKGRRWIFQRMKLPAIWFQATLVNAELILIGKRNDSGFVTDITKQTLPQIAGSCKKYWNGNAIKGFTKAVLEWALPQIEEGHTATIQYSWGKGNISLIIEAGDFLPGWYKDYVDKLYIRSLE